MYIFKYHPDNKIFRNGEFVSNFTDFMTNNPDFPIIENEFFEWDGEVFINIVANEHGTFESRIIENIEPYTILISAINNLE